MHEDLIRRRLASLSPLSRENLAGLLDRYAEDSPEMPVIARMISVMLDIPTVTDNGAAALYGLVMKEFPAIKKDLDRQDQGEEGVIAVDEALSIYFTGTRRSAVAHPIALSRSLAEHDLLIQPYDVLSSFRDSVIKDEFSGSSACDLAEAILGALTVGLRESVESTGETLFSSILERSSLQFKAKHPGNEAVYTQAYRSLGGSLSI